MIKINLLPFRAARQKENIRRQISVYGLSVIFLLLVIGYMSLNLNTKLNDLQSDKAQKRRELATYAETTKKIKLLETKKKQVRAKLDIIRGLEKKKTGPVRLLDELSMAVPRNKLWLTSLGEKKGILQLKGTAMDNDTVALFMTNLENAENINSVDLISAQLKTLADYDPSVTNFVSSCKTYAFMEKPKKKAKKSRRR